MQLYSANDTHDPEHSFIVSEILQALELRLKSLDKVWFEEIHFCQTNSYTFFTILDVSLYILPDCAAT